MRILFLMDQMHLHGGAEKILSLKMNYLLHHFGYDIHLITTEQRKKKPVYDLDSKLKWKDLEINYCRELSYFHHKNLTKIIRHFWLLRKEVRKIKPDLIISVSFSPDQYFLNIIQKKIPKIKEFHSSRFNYQPGSWIKQKADTVFKKYDALVVLNETEKFYYTNSNIEIIPNFTCSKSTENQKHIREKTIIAAGRIASVKQFDHLIKAWSIIALDFPDWKVKIFGDGDDILSAKLKLLIDELQIPNIYLMGATSHLNEEMERASVYALTSATECFPMVLLEAQAAGLPIISYDCPNGPRHIVQDEINGVLTPANEIGIFAAKLARLIRNEELRATMGSKAKKNVERYAQASIMQHWDALFEKLNTR